MLVKVEAYKESTRVAYMTFSGTNTDNKNWFSPNNLINSTWPDLQTISSFNVFHIAGGDYAYARHFYINKQHGGCSNDLGWFMVIDANEVHQQCLYDNQTYPAIFYSLQSSGTHWQYQAYGLADTMLIYVKQ
ncbi:hypothetical protein KUTeg_011063 [Tegillarca granosa]|uniref:Uncharacterized protein n=1 Tax=Tegillarca granosa TaxID=220873 RepID=A0ABQ9F2T3_TEGGR|nr:hypothetical protein KUTeg_011063 [Tegillarca granosa]